jgi:hypothetical protein
VHRSRGRNTAGRSLRISFTRNDIRSNHSERLSRFYLRLLSCPLITCNVSPLARALIDRDEIMSIKTTLNFYPGPCQINTFPLSMNYTGTYNSLDAMLKTLHHTKSPTNSFIIFGGYFSNALYRPIPEEEKEESFLLMWLVLPVGSNIGS